MEDIHNYKKRLERTLELIKDADDISVENKNTLLKFYESLVVEGMSISKTQRYLYDVARLAKLLKKNLRDATEEDLRSAVVDIETREWTIHTKTTFKMGIKKIYKFIDNITERGVSPERIKWLKTTVRRSQTKLPEDLLTPNEIESLIRNSLCRRDMAFIAALYESGCRIGEIGMLKIKDIAFDEYGAKIQVFGKTGSRRIRIVFSSPYLLDWINEHPGNNDRESYVWVKNDNELMSHTRMNSILKDSAKRAKIQKRIYPHLFRHSRATFLAGHLTESQLKIVMGWSKNSDTPGIYVHLNGRDADNAILKMNGVKIDEDKERIQLKSKQCLRCKTSNASTNKFCKVCGFVLDENEASKIIKEDESKNQIEEFMNKAVKNPEFLQMLVKKMAEMNMG